MMLRMLLVLAYTVLYLVHRFSTLLWHALCRGMLSHILGFLSNLFC